MKKLVLVIALIGTSVWAQTPAPSPELANGPSNELTNGPIGGLKATKFVVTETISLIDTNGQTFCLSPGLLPLSEFALVNEVVDSEEFTFHSMANIPTLFRGGDGEPPRGPVRIEFRNDVRSGRGILDMRFDNHRALFWLDHPVETDEITGVPSAPTQIRASAASSGQNIGLKLSVSRPSNGEQPLTLLLIEKDLRPVADVELEISNPGH